MTMKKSIAAANPKLQTVQQQHAYAVRFALSSSRIEGIKPSSALAKKLGVTAKVTRSSR